MAELSEEYFACICSVQNTRSGGDSRDFGDRWAAARQAPAI